MSDETKSKYNAGHYIAGMVIVVAVLTTAAIGLGAALRFLWAAFLFGWRIMPFAVLGGCTADLQPASDGMHVWRTPPHPIMFIYGGEEDQQYRTQRIEVEAAADWWNVRLPGAFVHELTPKSQVVTINPTFNLKVTDSVHTQVRTRYGFASDARVVSAAMYMRDTMKWLSEAKRQAVWRHELGHVLGLGHSPSPTHVMHRDVTATRKRVIHEADRMFLRLQLDRGCW